MLDQVLARSFSRHLLTKYPWLLIPYAAEQILGSLVMMLSFPPWYWGFKGWELTHDSRIVTAELGWIPRMMLGGIALTLIWLFFYIVLIELSRQISQNEPISLMKGFQLGFSSRLPKVFCAMILLILIITAILVTAPICYALIAGPWWWRSGIPTTEAIIPGPSWILILWLGLLGMLLLMLIPAAYVFIKLMLYDRAIVIDDSGLLESLSISWRITKGHWWELFALVIIMVVILMAAIVPTIFLKFPANLISSGIAGALITPIYVYMFTEAYLQLRPTRK